MFIGVVILLGYLGAKPIEEPYLTIAKYATMFYFIFFILAICAETYDVLFINYCFKNKLTIKEKSLIAFASFLAIFGLSVILSAIIQTNKQQPVVMEVADWKDFDDYNKWRQEKLADERKFFRESYLGTNQSNYTIPESEKKLARGAAIVFITLFVLVVLGKK